MPASQLSLRPGADPYHSFAVWRRVFPVWYRVHLTVADSAGRTGTTFRDVQQSQGDCDAGGQPVGGQPQARRSAGNRAFHVYRGGRGATDHQRGLADYGGQQDVRLQRMVRRRRANAHHHDAAGESDDHGKLHAAEGTWVVGSGAARIQRPSEPERTTSFIAETTGSQRTPMKRCASGQNAVGSVVGVVVVRRVRRFRRGDPWGPGPCRT